MRIIIIIDWMFVNALFSFSNHALIPMANLGTAPPHALFPPLKPQSKRPPVHSLLHYIKNHKSLPNPLSKANDNGVRLKL
jgi:hypothetical protein